MADRVRIGSVSELSDGQLHGVEASGTKLIVGKVGDGLCAARNKCPHLGLSLTSGPGGTRFSEGEVQCPWHNSRFDLRSGENRDWAPGFAGHNLPRWSHKLIALGRKPASLTTYEVSVEGDEVFVQL